MRVRVLCLVVVIELFAATWARAQNTCTVSGYLFNPDGSPAVSAQVNAIGVLNAGSSFVLTPVVLITDATGFTTFNAERLSTIWIVASALGLTSAGDAAILVPDAETATLDVLAASAGSPVSGFTLTPGSTPTLALSLQTFGINLTGGAGPPAVESFNGRSGQVTLTSDDISTALSFTPLDPSTVVGAVNASVATIDDARLSDTVVRSGVANDFIEPQSFQKGIEITGSDDAGSSALSVVKGTGTSSALDIQIDGTGKALRFFVPGVTEPRTYFNDGGMFYTNGWMVVSGTSHGTGDSYVIDHPSADPFMLGVWSDITGPAVQVRNSSFNPAAYLFSGLDYLGNHTFSIEADGRLQWGTTTRAAMDTALYRSAPGVLRTDGALSVGTSATIDGNAAVAGSLAVSGAMITLGGAQMSWSGVNTLNTSGPFSVNGSLSVGAADTQLYRQSAGTLRTDGAISVGGTGLFGGTVSFGAADTALYRSAPAVLRTNASVAVDGKLGVGGINSAYTLYVRGPELSSWVPAARFESAGNVNGGGATLDVFPIAQPFGARLYGGRWNGGNRGARLVGVDQLGREYAWVHLNGEGTTVTINTAGVDRLTVKGNGTVGINTASPAPDAALEVNGGDSKGFRIPPRSVPGAPASGTWSPGTIVVDSTGVVYICVAAGTPGTWQKLGAQ